LLALLLAYGAGNIANDAWLEQIAERGWSRYAIPSVLEPAANWLWPALLVAALAIWLLWFGQANHTRAPTASTSPSPPASPNPSQ
jgi:hypothetical protein